MRVDVDPISRFGAMCNFDWGVERDYAKALELYERAAHGGSVSGLTRHAILSGEGNETERERERGRSLRARGRWR